MALTTIVSVFWPAPCTCGLYEALARLGLEPELPEDVDGDSTWIDEMIYAAALHRHSFTWSANNTGTESDTPPPSATCACGRSYSEVVGTPQVA